MKAIQLKISLTGMKKTVMRRILISKKTTFEELHSMIQLLFNLDGVEAYTFHIEDKWIQKNAHNDVDKTLIRIKEKDRFDYYYDKIDQLHFKITAEKDMQADVVPLCLKAIGKNLYEGAGSEIEEELQSEADLEWINKMLAAFREEHKNSFVTDIQKEISKLIKIRYFQDYMHNQIVKLHLPCNRIVYMGCDASEDVVLNFHISADKLAQYMSINQQAPSQSIIKYHDCIELALLKRMSGDQPDDFDLNAGIYGGFLCYANVNSNQEIPYEYRTIYLEALRRYVKVITYCAENQIKYQSGRMIEYKSDECIQVCEGKMNILRIDYLNEPKISQIKKQYTKGQGEAMIEVITLPQKDELQTLCIVGNAEDGFRDTRIYCTSLKTMIYEIYHLLLERWQKYGIDRKLFLRDPLLKKELDDFAEALDIECILSNDMEDLDQAYYTENDALYRDIDPREVIEMLLKELGFDIHSLDQADVSKENILEKLKRAKDHKKYS